MAKYTGKAFSVDRSVAEINQKFSDLTIAESLLQQLTPEQRAQVGEIKLEKDSVAINTPQLGTLKFRVVENTPAGVVMKAEGAPIPMQLNVALNPQSDTSTQATCSVDVDLPAMLKPFVGPQLQKAVGMLSDIIEKSIQ